MRKVLNERQAFTWVYCTNGYYEAPCRRSGNLALEPPPIVWENEKITKTADEIMAANDSDGEHRTSRDEAADLLTELLTNGPMDTNDIRAQTQAAGLSWASVRRGKSWLKIKAERF